jgi:hypothetical protein
MFSQVAVKKKKEACGKQQVENFEAKVEIKAFGNMRCGMFS